MAEAIAWGSLPNVPRIAVDLAAGRREVISLLGGDWRQPDVRRAASDRRLNFKREAGLGTAIRRAYGDRELPEAVERNLEALDKPDTLAIVTGQQVGIFGGPLYTFYKAFSAVLLAEALRAEAPGAVVPVFWMETADADFGEVNRVNFPPTTEGPRRALYMPGDLVAGKAICFHKLGSEIADIRALVTEWIGAAPFRGRVAPLLEAAYRPGRLISDAFQDLLTELMGAQGLVVVNPLDPNLSLRMRGFWESVLRRPEKLNKAFAMASGEVEALQLPLQVRLRDDALPIMVIGEDEIRRRIHGDADNWTLGPGGEKVSLESLRALPETRPGALTPSALLRPLHQDYLLPTWFYVGGPAEIAYHSQVGRAYDLLDLPRPMIAPRVSFTLVERPQRRLLDRHGWKVMDVIGGRELLLRRQGKSDALEELFESGSDQLNGWLERIERMADEAGVNLAPEVDQSGRKISYQWDKLQRAAQGKLAERDRTRVNHAQRLLDDLMPDGVLQERHHSALYYLAVYGNRLMDIIRAEANLFGMQHLAVDLEPTV